MSAQGGIIRLKDDRKMSEILPQLILLVSATYTGTVGFGEVYTCQVRRVLVGTFTESVIGLTVLAKDKEKIGFIAAHLSPQEIELGFKLARRDERYALAPITGFVDAGRISWEIDYLREADR
jgi:hypothetical protein